MHQNKINQNFSRPPITKTRLRQYIRNARQEFYWRLNPLSWKSADQIKTYKNQHKGDRCFILGNGPSLNNMDLSLIKNEYTFGTNRIYLLFSKLGFITTYYISINQLVLEQFAHEITQLTMPKFLGRKSTRYFDRTEKTMFLHSRPGLGFSNKPYFYIYEGATVTYVTLQLAYFMGFDKIILIGVDHSYSTKGLPHKEVQLEEDDQNHFSPNYFGKGIRWQLPDLDTSEIAYKIALDSFSDQNRTIVDATSGGNLQVFPKVEYEELF